MLFCLLVFSIEVCTEVYKTKYLSKIKINSQQHQLTLTKALKSVENNGFIFNKISVLLQQATIIKVCFNDKVFSYNHQLLISKGCVNILRIKMMNIITLSANKLQYFKLPTSHSRCLQPNLTLASFLYEHRVK